MVSRILGPDGDPVSSADLATEVAMPTEWGVRNVYREGVASGLSPETLAALLHNATFGEARRYLTLAEEMEERYLHYGAQLQTRRLAIDALTPQVEAADGVPAKIVDAVKALVEDSGFDEMVAALQDAIAKGYSAVEIMWDYKDGLLKPVDYRWRDPRFFQFDRISLAELRLASEFSMDGTPLPPFKFIRHMPRSKMGLPLRGGVARAAAWAFMIQSFGLKDWAAFSEIYGLPIRLGRYGPTASKDDVRTLLRAVRSIASDAAAVIPIGMEMEFIKVEGSHGAAVFGELISYCDKSISKFIVGQTMTADDGSSKAQATVHNEVRIDILRADGKSTGATVTRDLVLPFVAFNFGPQAAYPRVTFPVAEPEDIAALSASLVGLVPLGLKVSQSEVRGKIGLGDPESNDDLLVAPAPPPPPLVQGDKLPLDKPRLPPDATHLPKQEDKPSLAHVAGCQCGPCLTSCLIPGFDGAIFSIEWKEALWVRFSMGAPRRQRRSVERYNIVKRA